MAAPYYSDYQLRLRALALYAIIVDMNASHRKTLDVIFAVPVPANLEWRRVEGLFVALGAQVIEGRGSLVATFHRPHPEKEAKPYQVRDAREFLTRAGIKP